MRVIILILVLLGSYTHAHDHEMQGEEDIQVFKGGSETFDESAGGGFIPHNQVEFQFGWLSVGTFQKLTTNEQNLIMVATRDTVVLSLHTMNQHSLETCVGRISQEELEAIRNTALEMPSSVPEIRSLVITGITRLAVQLCKSSQPQPKAKPESKHEKDTEGPI